MKSTLFLAALTAATAPQLLTAQSDEARRNPLPPVFPPRPPVVWVDPQAKLAAMQLQAAEITIQVAGHVATTRMELSFHNPNGRVIEGELVFPLGEGESVSGYELEVNGKMRQAVSVPKEKGREIFEDIVRRGIDPGLAELTKGNVFRTRLYPIPAKGIKKVAVTFQTELTETAEGFRYVLPLGWKDQIGKLRVKAEVVKQEVVPVAPAEAESLTFDRWQDAWIAEITRENYAAEKPLIFTVPKVPEQPRIFAVPDRLEPANGWFSVSVEAAAPPEAAMAAPKRVAIFYDASGSAAKRDRKREEAFLNAWAKAAGTVTLDLVVFRNEAEPVQTLEIRDGNAAPLLDLLRALPLDGGTSLGAVNVNLVPQAEMALLFSDGQSNFAASVPNLARQSGPGIRIFPCHAAQAADHPALERIARSTSARPVNLLKLSDADAVQALQGSVFQFLGAKVLSGAAMELAPELPVAVTRGFTLAGRYKGRTELELSFGTAGVPAFTRRVTIDPKEALPPERGEFVRRLWAQKRIAEMLPDAPRNEVEITRLGTENGVITPFNSLIVLERIEDYVRWSIEPPEADLRAEYQKLAAEKMKDRLPEQAAKEHLDEVKKEWKEFTAWHAKRHPWLETVLVPAAELELKTLSLIVAQGKEKSGGLTAADVEEVRVMTEKAKSLAARWLKDGADAASRAGWEQDAVTLMLMIDERRQKRIAAVPGSFVPNADGGDQGGRIFGTTGQAMTGRNRGAAPAARASSAPPTPAPAAPAPLAEAAAESDSVADAFSAGEGESRAKGKKDGGEASRPQLEAQIEVKPWNPDTPYLKKMRAAPDAYVAYMEERGANADSSAFYLDCADFFREEKKDERLALRILSNLAEMDYESAPLVRILAYRLQQTGRFDLAIPLFEEVLKMRGEEPQSRRDLALALARQPQPDYRRAAALLWEVVQRPWDGRFPGISTIALHELNALLASCETDKSPDVKSLDIPAELLAVPANELRVILTWDADATDIDLWVTDPTGETVMYSRNRGQTGGHVSDDFTQGYGPEVFTIARALPGTYTVHANYYGNRQQKLSGATTVQLEFQTAFGTAAGKSQSVTRRLTENKEVIEVGKFTFRPQLAKNG